MSAPSDDRHTPTTPGELRGEVERTRAELGATVQALVDKTDVKTRAKDKGAEVKERTVEVTEQAREKTAAVAEQAVARAEELGATAARAAHAVQDKVPGPVRDGAAQAVGQVRSKAAQAGDMWQEKAPEPLRRQTAQGARLARENRTLVLAAAGTAVIIWLAARHRKG
ncbi:DUF3618 domain-containing protein [Streptomyces sp. NPDC127038]|uniref:DUF3618 domain-containing protein n=1 Tax=Streptomyces sp. NPDC127038 TaxID=3347114 RepID=UPI00364F00C0